MTNFPLSLPLLDESAVVLTHRHLQHMAPSMSGVIHGWTCPQEHEGPGLSDDHSG